MSSYLQSCFTRVADMTSRRRLSRSTARSSFDSRQAGFPSFRHYVEQRSASRHIRKVTAVFRQRLETSLFSLLPGRYYMTYSLTTYYYFFSSAAGLQLAELIVWRLMCLSVCVDVCRKNFFQIATHTVFIARQHNDTRYWQAILSVSLSVRLSFTFRYFTETV